MIDEKGRIFGKLNIIDLLVILLVLLVGVFLVFKLIGRDGGSAAAAGQITYTVKVEGVVLTWKGTVKDRVEASAEVVKVWVAAAPGSVAPLRARFTVKEAGMDSPAWVETVLWKEAW